MITKILLMDYGPFREAEFSLAPLTVLVGPNSSGKTTAMEVPHQVFTKNKVSYLPERQRFGADLPATVGIEIDQEKQYVLALQAKNSDLPPGWEDTSHVSHIANPRVFLTRLNFEQLRKASYLEPGAPSIRPDGYGLPTILANMKLNDDERFAWIEQQVRTIVPSYEKISLQFSKVWTQEGERNGQSLLFHMKNAPNLRPEFVSDGTIFALGLITHLAELANDQQPTLLLIDELEHSLHPKALADLITCLRTMTETMNVQILATSHSPYLLDSLRPEEVRLTGFLEDGTATIRELSDHPDFERWKDVMTPGEFWATAGEDWIRELKQ